MNRTSKTVLIEDGNPSMRYYHGLLLMRLHYVVLTAENSREALLSTERAIPSIILTSFSEPETQGTDLIESLRSNDRTAHVPVIALVDSPDDQVRSACRQQGYAGCLVKPAEPHELYRAIQSVTEATPRIHIRINMSLKAVEGDEASGQVKTEYTTMISEGGMYLQTYSPAPNHTRAAFRLQLPKREIRAKTEVLYSNSLDQRSFHQPGMGLKFIDMRDDDRMFLRSFIRKQLVHDILPEDFRTS